MADLLDDIPQVVMMGLEGPSPSTEEIRLIERGIGGVILFERNCVEPTQVSQLIDTLQGIATRRRGGIPLCIAIDQEYGTVQRIKKGITPLPSAADFGEIGDPLIVRRAAEIIGEELAIMGVTMNLAPVADILVEPQNLIIGRRSFGMDPHLVGKMVSAFIQGLQAQGVAACAKHFPGHGATETDSHHLLPIIPKSSERLQAEEIVPFRYAVAAGVAAVMTGHLLLPSLDADLPATLSSAIIEGMLRGQLGFSGVVISDDLCMGALNQWGDIEARGVAAFKAGVDFLLVAHAHVGGLIDGLKKGIEKGDIPAERAMMAVARVRRLKEAYPYRGTGDIRELRSAEALRFSQHLFARLHNAKGDPWDRKA